jgi:hypothetical protein
LLVDGDRKSHRWFVLSHGWQLLDWKTNTAGHQELARQPAALLVLGARPFDLYWSNAHAVAILEHLVGSARLTIDTDQIVAGLASDPLFDKLAYRRAFLDFDVVGEPAAVVVDEQDLHFEPFLYVTRKLVG